MTKQAVSSRRQVRAAAAVTAGFLLAGAYSAQGQTNDGWQGGSSNLWTDPANWSLNSPPTAGNTAYFATSGGNTTVSLAGSTQAFDALVFDTSGAASYTVGLAANDGTLSLGTAGTNTLGAIAVTSSVTTSQIINSAVTLNAANSYITNSGSGGSLTFNGGLTLAAATTIITNAGPAAGSAAPRTVINGNMLLASTGTQAATFTVNGGNGTSQVSLPGGVMTVNGIIGGGLAGNGSLSSFSLLLNGTSTQTGESNGNAPGTASALSAGTYTPNSANTYSGGTVFQGNNMLVQVTGSGVGTVNGDGTTSVTSGPFGTGSFFVKNVVRLQPVNSGNYVIYNPIVKAGAGFSVTSSKANDTGSLTFAGPISTDASDAANGRYISNGNSLDENLPTPVYGATMVLGLASSPSTLTLPVSGTNAINSHIVGLSGPVVVNDVIQASAPVILTLNDQNQDFYSVRLSGANTYQGSTVLGGNNYNNMGATLIGTSSLMSGGNIVSGPFGRSTVYTANVNTPPVLVPMGGDQTVANPFILGAANGGVPGTGTSFGGSGVSFSNFYLNTVNTRGTQTTFTNLDPTGNHNLTLSGTITLASSRTLFNTMASGQTLFLGSSVGQSTVSLNGFTLSVLGAAVPTGYTMGGHTVINDLVTGTGGLTVGNGEFVELTNANTYTGTTTVNSSAASLPTARLLAMNGNNGSATGTGPVNVTGLGTLGGGGILGGTGTVAPTGNNKVTIGSTTAASQGGVVQPGTGNGNAGTLNVSAMVWDPKGRYVFAYTPDTLTSGSGVNSLISGSGTLDLSNLGAIATGSPVATPFDLNLQRLAGPTTGNQDTYTIATFAGGVLGNLNGTSQSAIANGTDVSNLFSVSGDFGALPGSDVVDVVAGPGGVGQSLVLTFTPVSVPEPGAITLIGAAAMGLGLRRRRRKLA